MDGRGAWSCQVDAGFFKGFLVGGHALGALGTGANYLGNLRTGKKGGLVELVGRSKKRTKN